MCDLVKISETPGVEGSTEDTFRYGMIYTVEKDDWFYDTRCVSNLGMRGKLQCHHGDGNWEDLPEVKEGEEAVFVPQGSYVRVVEDA